VAVGSRSSESAQIFGQKFGIPKRFGGALLDVGIYSVSLSSMTLGYPKNIISSVHLGETGVDEQGAIVLGYEQGKMAVLTMAIRAELPQEAYIVGTKGRICIHSPWWKSKRITLLVGKREEAYDFSFKGNGLNYEAEEVMKCLREGKRESDIMPLNETLAVMKILDQIRALWGLKYPME
jgi:predicted dehydrogenase